MVVQVAADYCSNPNVFHTASSSFIVQNNISRKEESAMVKSKVESSMPEVKVESGMRMDLSMVESKVKVESSMVGMELSNFNQKMKMGDKIEIKTEKRKSSRLTNKGPDEKRRLIG